MLSSFETMPQFGWSGHVKFLLLFAINITKTALNIPSTNSASFPISSSLQLLDPLVASNIAKEPRDYGARLHQFSPP